jgi:hypothetical protein
MTAIVVNNLSINTELDGKALAEIVGGRKGRNPQTGDPIKIKASNVVKYSWNLFSIGDSNLTDDSDELK